VGWVSSAQAPEPPRPMAMMLAAIVLNRVDIAHSLSCDR
jgi:hypothetical protein